MASSSPGRLPPLSTSTQSSPSRKSSNTLVSRSSQADLRSPSGLRRKSSQQFAPSVSPSQTRAHYTYEVPPPPTASQVASAHWQRELLLHEDANEADTVVIVHEACYGHRFSRLKTTKTQLSLIVERPERLQAGTVGLSNAYVRLGERHSQGQFPIHPKREPSKALPFRIHRTQRSTPITAPVVASIHGGKWTQELKQMCEAAEAHLNAHKPELARPETPSGNADKPYLHEGDLYLCKDSLDAFQGAIGGVLDGVDAIFDASSTASRKAFVCVRPPGHHCSSDLPSGFCWINNVHIGIEHAAQVHGLTHAAIIDFDLHHGDGSQSIAWERNTKALKAPKNAPPHKKTAIGYYSLHDINSYPCEGGDMEKVQAASLCIENAHGQSIWNVHLQPWKREEDFWKLYEDRYSILLEKTRNFLRHHTQRIKASPGQVVPKAAIFISAGFDASEHESEGMQRHKVNVPTGFYARFTADIVRLSLDEDLACQGRVISVLEGGYSDRALTSGVLSHLIGLTQGDQKHHSEFDSSWWTLRAMEELEVALGRAPQAQGLASRAIRPGDTGNYASPTQAFTNRAVDPQRLYKSVSGTRRAPSPPPKPPTPPPPEIDWAQATVELSKQLIPGGRSVTSMRHDELNDSKAKKERHSLPAQDTDSLPASGRQTRAGGRKAKAALDKLTEDEQTEAESNRRRTISSLPAPPESNGTGFAPPPIRMFDHDERPSTATGSPTKAFSAAPSTAASRRSSQSSRRSSPPPNRAPAALQPPKMRQSSGAQSQRPSVSRQSSYGRPSRPAGTGTAGTGTTPPLPKPSASRPESAAGQAGRNDSLDVDQLTNRVKKITLHMPKDHVKADEKAPAHPAKKSAAPTKAKSVAKSASTKFKAASKSAVPNNASGSAAAAAAAAGAAPTQIDEPPLQGFQSQTNAAPIGTAHHVAQSNDEHGALYSSEAHAMGGAAATQSQGPILPSPSSPNEMEIDSSSAPPTRPDTVMTGGASRSTASSPFEVNPEFIPYKPIQTAQPAPPGTIPPAGNLTWVEPNQSDTPARPQSKAQNLPVFTANSRIPFAPSPSKGPPQPSTAQDENASPAVTDEFKSQGEEKKTVWDVPETPAK